MAKTVEIRDGSQCFNCGEENVTVLSNSSDLINGLKQVFGRKMKNKVSTSKKALKSKSICNLCNSQFRKLLVAYDIFSNRTHPASRISCLGETILPTSYKQITPPEASKNEESTILELEYDEKIPLLQISKLSSNLCPLKIPKGTHLRSYYVCTVCGRKFKNEYKLQRHKNLHSEIKYSYSCQLCHKSFVHNWFYKNHLAHAHAGIELTFSCTTCKKNFTSQLELTQHVTKCHKNTSHPFECKHCDKAYQVNEIKLLRTHLIKFHDGTLEAISAQMNIRHIKEAEEKRKPSYVWSCSFCELLFESRMDTFYHTQIVHYELKSCPTCDKRLNSGGELSKHVEKFGHKLTECYKCEKNFLTTQRLLAHMDAVHNPCKNYTLTCEICGVAFRLISQLQTHYKWHVDIAAPSTFSCDQCDKSYSLKHHLQIHKSRKHSTINFICGFCDKSFTTKISLRRHEKNLHLSKLNVTETENTAVKNEASLESKVSELRHKCKLCNMSFDRPQGLNLHCRWAHLNSNFSKAKNSPKSHNVTNYAKYEKYLVYLEKEPDRKFECKICNTRFKRTDHIFRHIFLIHGIKLREHKGFQSVRCELCDQTFPFIKYRKHIKIHQNESNRFSNRVKKNKIMVCPICDAECVGFLQMYNHFLENHPGTKEAAAAIRNDKQRLAEKARKKNNVQHDINLETENRCSSCLKFFSTIAGKKRHEIEKHKTNTKCLVCDKSFKSEKEYRKHEDKDHKEYPCSYCRKVLFVAEELHTHLENDHLLQPFTCEFCWKSYTDWYMLLHHYGLHSSSKEIIIGTQCEKCNKTFKHKRSLETHMANNCKRKSRKPSLSKKTENESELYSESQASAKTRPKRGCTDTGSKKKYKKSKYLTSSDDSSNSDSEESPIYSSSDSD